MLTGHSCVSMLRRAAGARSVRLRMRKRALRTALASAGQQIAALAAAAGGEAAQILEFQVALLEDEDFLDPIFAAIRSGSAG